MQKRKIKFEWVKEISEREKGLDNVISYDTTNFDYIEIDHRWKTDKQERAEELINFLSQSSKKIKNYEWDSDVSKEKGFTATIYTKGKPVIASIYENRLVYYNDGAYYKVTKWPIDMGWLEKIFNREQWKIVYKRRGWDKRM